MAIFLFVCLLLSFRINGALDIGDLVNNNPGSIPCNESYTPFYSESETTEQMLERIQCYYEAGGVAWVDKAVLNTADNQATCTQGSPCYSIEHVKSVYKYNTEMHLIASTTPYELTPPANLTGHFYQTINFVTYFNVIGEGKTNTTIGIKEVDYDTNLPIFGSDKFPVVLYVSGPTTSFSISQVTIQLIGVDSGDSALVWIRNESHVDFIDVAITGDGRYWPKHLFEQSGGHLTLRDTVIAPSTSDPIKGAILFWDAAGRGGTRGPSHSGSWSIFNSAFENITFDSGDSLLDDPNNKDCTLIMFVQNTNFTRITSVYSGPVSVGRIGNADQKALIFSYGNTRGSKTITTAGFKNLVSVGHTAPLAVLNLPIGDDIYTGLGLTIIDCSQGSASGTIAAYASIAEDNTIFGITTATGNTRTTPDGYEEPSNQVTPMSDDVIICIDGLDVNCPEDTKTFPIWVIVVIVVVAVVVVAVVVVIVAVAVYLHKKKYSTLSDEEDYNESSSSSIRSAEKNDELDSI